MKEANQEKIKSKCYNCKHASQQFKVGNLTHLHCFHPKYPEQDFIDGKLSSWDTLQVFSDTCKDHEFKTNQSNLK